MLLKLYEKNNNPADLQQVIDRLSKIRGVISIDRS